MKLNFGRRLVLFVHWLLSLAACALGVALFVWPECRVTVAALLQKTDVFIYAIAVLAVYLIFAAGSVAIIFGGRKRGKDGDFIIVDSSETGRTRIAVSAVQQMIRQAVRGVNGIAEMKATIINKENAVAINADVAIVSGAHVPTVTANIQRAIRGYIEQNCGVAVRGVSVNVHSLAEEQPEGRRGRKKKTEVGNYSNPTPVWEPKETTVETANEPVAPAYVAPVEPGPEEEPIALTLDPELEPAPVEPEAPAEEAAPEPERKKGRFFGKFFGKKEEPAAEAAAEEPAVELAVEPETESADDAPDEAEPVDDATAAEDFFAVPAEDDGEAEERSIEE